MQQRIYLLLADWIEIDSGFAHLRRRNLRNLAKFCRMSQSRPRSSRKADFNDSAAIAAQCAHRLLELRTHTGETQKQLAKRLAMTESMISRLERGDHVPSLATLCRIADAFGRRLEIVCHGMNTCTRTETAIPILIVTTIPIISMIMETKNDCWP